MSRSAEITLAFAGEDRLFRLPIDRLRTVQERCDAGPMELIARLAAGSWRVDDIREPILQGLVGGGMAHPDASRLMTRDFDGLPLQGFVPVARAVLMAAVVGAPDEDADEDDTSGEDQAGEEAATLSREESFGSEAFTAPEPR